MKLFFAGAEGTPWLKMLTEHKAENVLQSYWYLKKGKAQLYRHGDLLIDSGGYTARLRGIAIKVDNYAQWLNENGVKVAFNLDTNDLQETLENQKYLEKYTDTYIIPIYHLTDYLSDRELLDQFMAYPYIGISAGGAAVELRQASLRQEFVDYVFDRTRDKVAVHGLGMTSNSMLRRYPFYSVDSTSWLSSSRYGVSAFNRKSKLQHSRTKTVHYLTRTSEELISWQKQEKRMQNLWAARGVSWPTSLDSLLSTWRNSRKPVGITRQTILRKQKTS